MDLTLRLIKRIELIYVKCLKESLAYNKYVIYYFGMFSLYLCHALALSFNLLSCFLLYLNLANTFLKAALEDTLQWDWKVLGKYINNIQDEYMLKVAYSLPRNADCVAFYLKNVLLPQEVLLVSQLPCNFYRAMTYKLVIRKLFETCIA